MDSTEVNSAATDAMGPILLNIFAIISDFRMKFDIVLI